MNGKMINFNISFDPEAGAMYIKFSLTKVAKTIELKEEVFIDVDAKGNLIGIEFLNPCKADFRLKEITKVFKAPQLKSFDPKKLEEAIELMGEAAPAR